MASSPASGDTYGAGETITVGLTMRTGRDGAAARAAACLAGGRRRGAPGRVFRAGGERDADPRILVHGAGGRHRHGRRAAVLERPAGHRLRADPPERRHHPRGRRRRRRARHAEAGRAGRAQGGRNGADRHRAAVNGSARRRSSVRPDWALAPSGVGGGGKFRLLFITSSDTQRDRAGGRSGRTTRSCRDGRMPDTAPSGHTARVSA